MNEAVWIAAREEDARCKGAWIPWMAVVTDVYGHAKELWQSGRRTGLSADAQMLLEDPFQHPLAIDHDQANQAEPRQAMNRAEVKRLPDSRAGNEVLPPSSLLADAIGFAELTQERFEKLAKQRRKLIDGLRDLRHEKLRETK